MIEQLAEIIKSEFQKHGYDPTIHKVANNKETLKLLRANKVGKGDIIILGNYYSLKPPKSKEPPS